jgi:hypothetical protein
MYFVKFFGGIRGFLILTRDLEKNVGKPTFTTHPQEAALSL